MAVTTTPHPSASPGASGGGAPGGIAARIDALDWARAATEVDTEGWTILPKLLTAAEADGVTALYPQDAGFRSKVVMAQHGFGRGQYKYFSYPLPDVVEALRTNLYPRLAPLANGWLERLGKEDRFPPDHAAYLERCHSAGQLRPTPLLLEYGVDDYNCLHQDLYGENVFPLQVAILLAEPGKDFEGGEFVMTEQRPRMQTRAMVVEPLGKGDAVLFAVNSRPVRGVRGEYQVKLRHGVSRLRAGRRHTLGVIFHDAT
jgi:hypothetical protein